MVGWHRLECVLELLADGFGAFGNKCAARHNIDVNQAVVVDTPAHHPNKSHMSMKFNKMKSHLKHHDVE